MRILTWKWYLNSFIVMIVDFYVNMKMDAFKGDYLVLSSNSLNNFMIMIRHAYSLKTQYFRNTTIKMENFFAYKQDA